MPRKVSIFCLARQKVKAFCRIPPILPEVELTEINFSNSMRNDLPRPFLAATRRNAAHFSHVIFLLKPLDSPTILAIRSSLLVFLLRLSNGEMLSGFVMDFFGSNRRKCCPFFQHEFFLTTRLSPKMGNLFFQCRHWEDLRSLYMRLPNQTVHPWVHFIQCWGWGLEEGS